jgi:hypothetical protein
MQIHIIQDILDHTKDDITDRLNVIEKYYSVKMSMRREYKKIKQDVNRYIIENDIHIMYDPNEGEHERAKYEKKIKSDEWNDMSCKCIVLMSDNVDLLKYAYEHGCVMDEMIEKIERDIKRKRYDKDFDDRYMREYNLGVIDFQQDMTKYDDYMFMHRICDISAKFKRNECFKYLCEHGCSFGKLTMIYAITERGEDIIKYLRDTTELYDCEMMCIHAVANDDLEEFKNANMNRIVVNGCIINYMLNEYKYDMIMYLDSSGYTFGEGICETMVKHDNYEGLRYFHEKGEPINKRAMEYALQRKYSGSINERTDKYIKYIIEKCGTHMFDIYATCEHIIKNNDIEIFKIIVDNGEDMDEIIVRTIIYNYDEGMEYIKRSGCTINERHIHMVIEERECSAETLEYLRRKGYEMKKEYLKTSALSGNLECLKYLHEIGVEWTKKVCEYAAINGEIECLRYAHENGCPWDDRDIPYLYGECEEYYETHMRKNEKINVLETGVFV